MKLGKYNDISSKSSKSARNCLVNIFMSMTSGKQQILNIVKNISHQQTLKVHKQVSSFVFPCGVVHFYINLSRQTFSQVLRSQEAMNGIKDVIGAGLIFFSQHEQRQLTLDGTMLKKSGGRTFIACHFTSLVVIIKCGRWEEDWPAPSNIIKQTLSGLNIAPTSREL